MEGLVSFWKGKKVFITGHTGFKGSWMLALLNLFGAECMGYALPPERPSMYEIIGGERLCQSVYADIRDRERLFKELSEFEPEVVFHLAAQPLVIEGYREPALTFETNVLGTVNLLECARKAGSVK
ncbi:MAG: NAD-dependent epimerase/dehydratase family protein, partial [Clostridiales bacterium]|nr:NAD-dependent epimerase/dehydratase family protein [Clostridiales bacterium]